MQNIATLVFSSFFIKAFRLFLDHSGNSLKDFVLGSREPLNVPIAHSYWFLVSITNVFGSLINSFQSPVFTDLPLRFVGLIFSIPIETISFFNLTFILLKISPSALENLGSMSKRRGSSLSPFITAKIDSSDPAIVPLIPSFASRIVPTILFSRHNFSISDFFLLRLFQSTNL